MCDNPGQLATIHRWVPALCVQRDDIVSRCSDHGLWDRRIGSRLCVCGLLGDARQLADCGIECNVGHQRCVFKFGKGTALVSL